MFMNCMLLAVIGKYDGLKNPLRMLLLNLASVDLVATTLGSLTTLPFAEIIFRHIPDDPLELNGLFLFGTNGL